MQHLLVSACSMCWCLNAACAGVCMQYLLVSACIMCKCLHAAYTGDAGEPRPEAKHPDVRLSGDGMSNPAGCCPASCRHPGMKVSGVDSLTLIHDLRYRREHLERLHLRLYLKRYEQVFAICTWICRILCWIRLTPVWHVRSCVWKFEPFASGLARPILVTRIFD